jgi:GT2 family glycosyltransferase
MSSCVVVLNWNGWKDTIECLESLFRLTGADFRVVVCDNGSSDGSLERIKHWARGDILAGSVDAQPEQVGSLTCSKPLSFRELTREQAELTSDICDLPLTLIQNGANLGFAAGNNTGLRYALRDPNFEYFWLLNNDAKPAPDALSALVTKIRTDQRVGAVASICYYAAAPETVQAWAGARVNLWVGYARNSTEPRSDDWFQSLYGASFLIRRAALEDAGLMDEGYFLYWEETDFCLRLRKAGWRLAAAPDSRVLHKVNASTGGNSLILDRYFTTSGLRLLRLHSPAPHLAMSLFLFIRLMRRLIRLRFANCQSIWAGVRDYLQMGPVIPNIR